VRITFVARLAASTAVAAAALYLGCSSPAPSASRSPSPSPASPSAPSNPSSPEADAHVDTDAGPSPAANACDVGAIAPPPASLALSPFYTRWLDASGIPVVSSDAPDPNALARACTIVNELVEHRDDVRLQMIAHSARVAVMGKNQVTTDIPEHSDLNTAFPGTDWDTRARGLGGTVARPVTSCAEENVSCLPGDAYVGENILVHEFAHGMMALGIVFADTTFAGRLEKAYASAMSAGLWTDTYAASNVDEYWAEGVQDWFDANLEAVPTNGIHNSIDTRAELKTYDPGLYALIQEIYTADMWTPGCP
jgi:hypothetical protein